MGFIIRAWGNFFEKGYQGYAYFCYPGDSPAWGGENTDVFVFSKREAAESWRASLIRWNTGEEGITQSDLDSIKVGNLPASIGI